ncbi:MAG TPA: hypothetical protein VMF06_01100 [Candidatus Limnocylindria bacterium]|jgi:hypothetical protein|nr:hypothetical protein [Candidatus Limnocylindria bacterium]
MLLGVVTRPKVPVVLIEDGHEDCILTSWVTTMSLIRLDQVAIQSGVALRLPPHSKTLHMALLPLISVLTEISDLANITVE